MDNYENFTNERQQLAQSWSEREYNRRDELREKKKPWVRALEKFALWTVIVAIAEKNRTNRPLDGVFSRF